MSSDQTEESVESDAREQFEAPRGSVPRKLDVADNEHPIKQALGSSSHRKLTAHEGTLGQRFAFRYSRAEAFLREYLANAETGCIRRCRFELKEHDSDTYNSDWFDAHKIPELIDEAREVVGYYPVIETHEAPDGASRDRFVIEDNAIGISVTEFVALKELGLSASHDEGRQLGNFGQGVMSVFNVVGEYGELTLETYSRRDEANYRERFRIDGFNDLPGKRDDYGTTWKIPAFSEEASDVDITEAIEEYTTAMYVPVIHHEYNEESEEVGKEEYTYEPLSSLVPDGEPVFVYEDDCVEAVMSPAIDDPQTFLVSQPIERGCSTTSYVAPFKFHLRVKKEDGSIYKSTHEDVDNTGLVPVEEVQFKNELIKDRKAVYPDQLVPGDLVGYNLSGRENRVVPTGVDDEIVQSRDDLELMEFNSELNHPDTDPELDPVVVDGPHEGYSLVTEQAWHNIETDVESTYIPYSEINVASKSDLSRHKNTFPSGYDIALVEPVDDRDRFEAHDGVLVKAVSMELNNMLRKDSAEVFENVAKHGFGEYYNLDPHELDLFTTGYETYIGSGSDPSPQYIRSNISENYGIDIDTTLAEQLATLSRDIEHAPRDSYRPNKKAGRTDTKISKVLRKAGSDGDVYMGATIHADKAELVWNIDDSNQVVAVDGSHMYDEYKELFGWKPLKTISLRNIAETYDVSDDVASKLERSARSSNGTGGVSLSELEAKSREIKLRSAKKGSYWSTTPKEVKEELNSDTGTLSDDDGTVEHLLVFRETDVSGIGVGSAVCVGNISRTIVPNYVADYLEDVDRCYMIEGSNYESAIGEIREQMLSETFDVIDIEPLLETEYVLNDDDEKDVEISVVDEDVDLDVDSESLGNLGSETIGLVLDGQISKMLEENNGINDNTVYNVICKSLVESDKLNASHKKMTIVSANRVDRTIIGWNPLRTYVDSPDLIRHESAGYNLGWNASVWRPSRSVKLDLLLPEDVFDRDTIEWQTIVKDNSYNIKKDRKSGKALVNLLHHLADHVPDDEPVFPSTNED